MRGKKNYKKRTISPDPIYNSVLVAEFINKILYKGKKEIAKKIVYTALEVAAKKVKKKPLEVFEQAIANGSPEVEVRSKRIGGANYQIPMEVQPSRKTDLVLRWLIDATRTRRGKGMGHLLADELASMYNNEGSVIKKRDDVHRMAEANRAFAHFARF